DDAAIDDGPPDRSRLGRRPHLRGVSAERTEGVNDWRSVGRWLRRQIYVEGQVGQRSPEVVVRVAVAGSGGTEVVEHLDGAVDDRVTGQEAQAGDLGVVANLEHQRAGRRSVGAWLEVDGIALTTELAADRHLQGGDVVQVTLDDALAHAVAEHADI